MAIQTADFFRELIKDKRKFIETLLPVENKARQRIPFRYNTIQSMIKEQETGMDIWVKPSSVGFSTERIADRLVDTLTNPGTNTVLVAYDDFITERLLNKVNFFYNHLETLQIPGFPEIHHSSTYEKTFRFKQNGVTISESSIYIASARSKTAGRAEVIHHLLLDEHAFYIPQANENIIAPALARIPPGGTCDSFSTPNGEENDFYDWYSEAKAGNSIFTAHFFPWWLHDEYAIEVGDSRLRTISDTDKPTFLLTLEEETLMFANNLSWDQMRWRRWMQKVMNSLKAKGKIKTLFPQEFAEDDVSCFMSTGTMYYETDWMEKIAKTCYEAPIKIGTCHIWYQPEEGKQYLVIVDPSQAKFTQSSIGVMTFEKDEHGNIVPVWCARDNGWYSTEDEYEKACILSDYYNRAMLVWEANGHGLAFTLLAKSRRPIYFRKDIIDNIPTMMPGWYTSKTTKEFMMNQVRRYLPTLKCHDIELVRQFRNFRDVKGKLEIVGYDDIHDSFAIGLAVHNPNPIKRGLQGQTGYKQDWGKKKGTRRPRLGRRS